MLIRHVATIDDGFGRDESEFRVNGKPAVGLIVFKDESANLVRLGRDVRERLGELEAEFEDHGLEFQLSFDAADAVEDQISRLRGLGLSGFAIALVVLLGFLREVRAVAVVAVAVPVSLLAALAMLFVGGYSINLLSLFGLAVGIGMLVDNSIVVYEAVQRQLERGASPDDAAEQGIARTVRAILAASATNAVVFLPLVFIDIDNSAVSSLLAILAVLDPAAPGRVDPRRDGAGPAAGASPRCSSGPATPREDTQGEFLPRRSPPAGARARGLLRSARRGAATPWCLGFRLCLRGDRDRDLRAALRERARPGGRGRPGSAAAGRHRAHRGQSLDAAREVVESLREAGASIEGVRMVETLAQEDGGWVNLIFEDPEDLPRTSPRRGFACAWRRSAESLSPAWR